MTTIQIGALSAVGSHRSIWWLFQKLSWLTGSPAFVACTMNYRGSRAFLYSSVCVHVDKSTRCLLLCKPLSCLSSPRSWPVCLQRLCVESTLSPKTISFILFQLFRKKIKKYTFVRLCEISQITRTFLSCLSSFHRFYHR